MKLIDIYKKRYLKGITSWGNLCGDGGVYTRTQYYYDWIINVSKSV
jgi:secreted trypsin-like serine protease